MHDDIGDNGPTGPDAQAVSPGAGTQVRREDWAVLTEGSGMPAQPSGGDDANPDFA
jgi:hypothetical protein